MGEGGLQMPLSCPRCAACCSVKGCGDAGIVAWDEDCFLAPAPVRESA